MASSVAIRIEIGCAIHITATPPIIRMRSTSSVAYATDDKASDDRTARPPNNPNR
jgi:hypothetical protein